MRVGAIIPSYRMTHFLPDCLRALKDLDEVLVLISKVGWEGNGEDNSKNCVNLLEQDNVKVISGNWTDQTEHRNAGLAWSTCDWTLVIDSDEILLDVDKLVEELKVTKLNAVTIKIRQYVGDLYNVSNYDRQHCPIIAVRKGTTISDIRCVDCEFERSDLYLHHLKFLQPPADLEWRKANKKQSRSITSVQSFDNPDAKRLYAHLTVPTYKNDVTGGMY